MWFVSYCQRCGLKRVKICGASNFFMENNTEKRINWLDTYTGIFQLPQFIILILNYLHYTGILLRLKPKCVRPEKYKDSQTVGSTRQE